jgi:hypothetical protein
LPPEEPPLEDPPLEEPAVEELPPLEVAAEELAPEEAVPEEPVPEDAPPEEPFPAVPPSAACWPDVVEVLEHEATAAARLTTVNANDVVFTRYSPSNDSGARSPSPECH